MEPEDADVPALDDILKNIVEKQGPLSNKERVLLLKAQQKQKRQVDTATSELQEQQQQNNQLKSHYLDAIMEWMKRSAGPDQPVSDDDRQRLNNLLSSPEGTRFITSATGNRMFVSATKSAAVPDFKTREQLEEERYARIYEKMLRKTSAPGTSVGQSVSASAPPPPQANAMQNVQASAGSPMCFTQDQFKSAFQAPLRVAASSSSETPRYLHPQNPDAPYKQPLGNVMASSSSGAPRGSGPPYYTSGQLGWKYVPPDVKVTPFAKALLDASKTHAMEQVDMMVVAPPAAPTQAALFRRRIM